MQIKNGSLVTKKLLRAWRACWDDARIDAFLKEQGKHVRGLSIETVLRDPKISLDERLWVGTKYLEAADPQACRLFAIEQAMSCAKYAGDEDAIENHIAMCSWHFEIELVHGGDEELRSAAGSAARSAVYAAESAAESAAWSAARSAAYSAARSAAESAAYSAAYNAARSAAYSAAYSAAESAACSAAYSAAYSAAIEASIDNILAWLTPYPENL